MNKELYIIENWIQRLDKFNHWLSSEYTVTAIPELTQAMRKRTCSIIVLNWTSKFTIIERKKRTFIGTQELGEVYTRLRKIVNSLRLEGEVPEEKIPLIVVCDRIWSKTIRHMYSWWGEALFIARRILYDRTDDMREIVYLAKSAQHKKKLKNLWESVRKYDKWTEKITVRIETDIRDILWPIEAREYPEFIRIPPTMAQKMYIWDRELELGEYEAWAFLHPRIWKKESKKRWGIIPLIDRDDENIPSMLIRLTWWKTQVQFYGWDYSPAEASCYLHINIPKKLTQVLWI